MAPIDDRAHALAKYRRWVVSRDRAMDDRVWRTARRRPVAQLDLRLGDTVLDVACGTGENFPLIAERVGEKGSSSESISARTCSLEARARLRRAGWKNIELIEAAVEGADLPRGLDAALFSFTHDVVRSPGAVENALASLAPGARVGAVGGKWAPWPAAPANLLLWLLGRRAVTTFEGFRRPCTLLARASPRSRDRVRRAGQCMHRVGPRARGPVRDRDMTPASSRSPCRAASTRARFR